MSKEKLMMSNCNNLAALKVRWRVVGRVDEVNCDDEEKEDGDEHHDCGDIWEVNSSSIMTESHVDVNKYGCISALGLKSSQYRNLRTVTLQLTPSPSILSPQTKTNAWKFARLPPLVWTANGLNLSGCTQLCNVLPTRKKGQRQN